MTVEDIEANGNPEQSEHNEENKSVNLAVRKAYDLPNGRPIEPSHLQVVDTYSSVGSNRPITKSNLDISSTLTISGNRPITVSHLHISESYSVMGNRPVASNQIDDPTALMGFLD
jgi:hypothetical protein